MLLQELGYRLDVFHMLRHTDMERFQTQIQDESVIPRGLHGTEVAHELGGTR